MVELSMGHVATKIQEYLFDYLLYPFVIFTMGVIRGAVVMSLLSLVACFLMLRFYDWSKRDWLGIEALKSLKDYDGSCLWRRIVAWLLLRSDPVACVLLSIKFDPFIVTTYLRKGHYGGMSTRDWRIFLLSWLVGNAYWSLLCFVGVETIFQLWRGAGS